MRQKTAFFDMDGTVSAPLFYVDGKPVTGFLDEKWSEYCDGHKERAYKDCPPVWPVVEYAIKLRSMGYDVRILTFCTSDGEKEAKVAWVEYNDFSDVFSEIICVESPDAKIKYMREYARRNGLSHDECMLVEDDLLTMLKAQAAGFRAMHVTHVFTKCYDAAFD